MLAPRESGMKHLASGPTRNNNGGWMPLSFWGSALNKLGLTWTIQKEINTFNHERLNEKHDKIKPSLSHVTIGIPVIGPET